MAAACEVVENQNRVKVELESLGLRVDDLLEVIRHVGLTMNSQTEDHPSWGVGITVASEGVFALRSILKPRGWTKEEEKGFALAVHPEGHMAINLAKGDEGTGDPLTDVMTVSEKGICTENAISKNQLCLDLPETEPVEIGARSTWYLIYSKRGKHIFAEFSLPFGLSESKQISKWRKRIMLPVTSEDGDADMVAGFEDGGFEVKLRRKK